ncbi:ABC transporter permease [Limnochorda pilosa]|uniref:Transport permease protein n=1 Tax=Limnochorda pilosa TaxID=1555112 RepID=A0A0K2SQM7_LIMPI|nr:ABC transporter permease [Limnochorda pilosa]BAS29297.1 ABC transporter [Limnochorda pilosa]
MDELLTPDPRATGDQIVPDQKAPETYPRQGRPHPEPLAVWWPRLAWAALGKELRVSLLRYPGELVGLLLWPALFPLGYVFAARAAAGPQGEALGFFAARAGTGNVVAYVLLGATIWFLVNILLWDFGNRIRYQQVQGMLEVNWSTPVPTVLLVLTEGLPALLFLGGVLGISLLEYRFVYGMQISGSLGWMLATLAASLPYLYGLGLVFAAATAWVKEVAALVYVVRGLVMIFSGVTFPLEVLPGWMQQVAALLPPTYTIRAVRTAALTPGGWAAVADDVRALLVFGLVFLPLGLVALHAVERWVRRTGTLTSY